MLSANGFGCLTIAGRWGGILVTAITGIEPNKPALKRRNEMKPTVDSLLAQHKIRLYNGSWYVHEKKLREMLEQIIEEAYAQGWADADNVNSEQFVNFGGSKK